MPETAGGYSNFLLLSPLFSRCKPVAGSYITIDVEKGPTLRTALDVLDLAVELADAIPESRRDELINRARGLREAVINDLTNRANDHNHR